MDLKTKRSRMKYTKKQVEHLQRVFDQNQYPDTDTQETLATDIGVSTERISIWFQNRRSKFKRHSRPGHVTWMRKHVIPIDETTDCLFGTPRLPTNNLACHVLSPLESQVNRDDVSVECNSILDSPRLTDLWDQKLPNTISPTTPDTYRSQNASAGSFVWTSSGSCMEERRLGATQASFKISAASLNVFELPRRDTKMTHSSYLQDRLNSNPHLKDISNCDVKTKQFTTHCIPVNQNDVIDKENARPNIHKINDNFPRVKLSNRLSHSDMFQHETTRVLQPSSSVSAQLHPGYTSLTETYAGYQQHIFSREPAEFESVTEELFTNISSIFEGNSLV